MNPKESNPNDFKVVSFHNSTGFGFTPEMGCMYDGRPINGALGGPGINVGETVILPYHIGKILARNLAKVALTREAPAVDPAGIPTGVPLWDKGKLDAMASSYLKDLYTEAKPTAQSETEKLIAKVEELNKWKESMEAPKAAAPAPVIEKPAETKEPEPTVPEAPKAVIYQDKAEVIAELTKRGIKFNARQTKATLEKLLV